MMIDPRMRAGRIVLAASLLLLLGIGACSIPSSYDAEVGQALSIKTGGGEALGEGGVDALLASLDDFEGIENVSVNERISEAGRQVDILLWGESIDAAALEARIRDRFPELAGAEISVEPLAGTVECNLGGRVLHDLFEIEVSGGDAESIRQQVLAQLAAQGHENAEVAVELNEADGEATIEIEITEER